MCVARAAQLLHNKQHALLLLCIASASEQRVAGYLVFVSTSHQKPFPFNLHTQLCNGSPLLQDKLLPTSLARSYLTPNPFQSCCCHAVEILQLNAVLFLRQLLTESEKRIMREAAEKEVPVGQTKLFEPIYKLKTGMAVAAANGLEDRLCIQQDIHSSCFCREQDGYHSLMGKGVRGIQIEVNRFAAKSPDKRANEIKSILHYIRFEETREKHYPNGIMDKDRGKMKLSDFCANPKAKQARLTEAEVVAIRLYTTLAYIFMNNPLRDEERYEQGIQCPLPVTTSFAASGTKKLRALQETKGEITLWRGMRNLKSLMASWKKVVQSLRSCPQPWISMWL